MKNSLKRMFKKLSDSFRKAKENVSEVAATAVNAAIEKLDTNKDNERLRVEGIKNMLNDPNIRLGGAARKRLQNALARNLSADPEQVKYHQTPRKLPAGKIAMKLLEMPVAKLARYPDRIRRQINGITRRMENATPRQRNLLEPELNRLKLWQAALKEVIQYRQSLYANR